MSRMATAEDGLLCPLVRREIAEGYCLEVNYEQIGLFQPDALLDVYRETGLSLGEVVAVCAGCRHQPLQPTAETPVARDA